MSPEERSRASSVALSHEIFIHSGNFYDDIRLPIRDTLTTQSRLKRRHGSFIELIIFVIGTFVTAFQALLHNDVTGRTGANPTTDMLQIYPLAHGDIQNAPW